MISTLLFDLPENKSGSSAPGLWLKIALLLTISYLTFAMILLGFPQLSKGAIVFALASVLWLLVGLTSRQATFPPILALPFLFYIFVLVSGLYLETYPLDYMGRTTTVWMGAIAVAIFVANGVSVNLVIAIFVAMFLANMVAIGIGYDSGQINVNDYDLNSLQSIEITRHSGIAGHINKLVGLVFTLPFLLFLMRKRLNIVLYLATVAICITTIVISGSRSTIGFSLLFILTGALWLVERGHARNLLLFLGVIAAVFALVFVSNEHYLSTIENSPLGELTIVKRSLGVIDGDASADTRQDLATGFWSEFEKKPMLGHGPEMFAEVYGQGLYAHNNLAEIAINWGLVGLILYYSMYVVAFIGILLLPRRLPMLATLMFLVMADIGFVTIVNRGMVLTLCLLLIVIYPMGSVSTKDKSRKKRRRRRHSNRSRGLEV